MSKEIQCKCCKEYWWETDIHSKSGLCPNCYDYFANLEAKLAESEKEKDYYQDLYFISIKGQEKLKQQLHDLPKKIVEEVEKNFTEYLPLKYKTGAGFYLRLNTILKKYGGENESLCCNVKQ